MIIWGSGCDYSRHFRLYRKLYGLLLTLRWIFKDIRVWCSWSRMRFYARSCAHLFWWPKVTGRSLPWTGRSARRCSRRDSGHRDGRERRELLCRAAERLRRDEEPSGPLQRPALRGQERTRWAKLAVSLPLFLLHTDTYISRANTHTREKVCACNAVCRGIRKIIATIICLVLINLKKR